MDFDSPETEQDFPGLYTDTKAGNEDEGRKILSVKKKKDKDKDKGYKAFEEDGSGGSTEDVNKASSSRRFKFGKSSSKSINKPVKVKLFGVELSEVAQRNASDDPKRPLVPRFLLKALDYLEKEYIPGLNFYKGTSHFKSKIHAMRHALNYGEEITLQEPQIVAGLIKLFVRELPGHILGSVLESKLEEARLSDKKAQKIQNLYKKDVHEINRAVFERLVLHMEIIGIDLTPLLRVSQKALSMLRPVITPLSVEDELKVEEARLARIQLLVAKAKESTGGTVKDKGNTKENSKIKENEEKLWEAQRNVTQLKRKIKQNGFMSSTGDDAEFELNLEERKDESSVKDRDVKDVTVSKSIDAEPGQAQPPDSEKNIVCAAVPHEVEKKSLANQPMKHDSEDDLHSNVCLQEQTPNADSQITSACSAAGKECENSSKETAPSSIERRITSAPEPKHDSILQPVPAPRLDSKASETDKSGEFAVSTLVESTGVIKTKVSTFSESVGTMSQSSNNGVTVLQQRNDERFPDAGIALVKEDGSRGTTAGTDRPEPQDAEPPSSQVLKKPEALCGKPLSDVELHRLQQEWRLVIAEQVDLLRMNHDLKRRIRDEHKQIKMIQMVRNHKSRMTQVSKVPVAYHEPLEKMSIEKLQDVLQRLIRSNAKLTKDTYALSQSVFDERIALARARAIHKCSQ